jgi:hypothetical protein
MIMIVKIHSRGKGVGTGPVEYLLGKNRDREQAVLLSGDPDQTIALIDSLDFKTKYTSGTLSFEEKDIPAEQKQSIMDSLESHLMAGLDRSQYDILWVQHQDKDRLELNFVIPNVELTTGKRINPYYDKTDRARNDAWQEITNHDYGLSDPNSPDKKQLLRFNNDLPPDKLEAKKMIHRTLLDEVDRGEIANRADIIKSLESKGVEVSRQTKNSISIKLPGEARAIRFNGEMYEQSFKSGAGVREEIEAELSQYRQEREQRVRKARNVYQQAHQSKCEYHRERYQPKRREVSNVVKREHQRIRKEAEQRTATHQPDTHNGNNNRNADPDNGNPFAAQIQHHKLINRVKKHDRFRETASRNNKATGTELRATTNGISDTINRLAESVKRYAESAYLAYQLRRRQLEQRRANNESTRIKFGR